MADVEDVENDLAKEHCQKITASSKPLNEAESSNMVDQLAGWNVFYKDGEPRLEKAYDFENFEKALEFTDEIGELANIEDHHPAILTEYGKVTVDWWTHKIKGLHRNDFIMAAKTDDLYVRTT